MLQTDTNQYAFVVSDSLEWSKVFLMTSQIQKFPALMDSCAGNPSVTGGFPLQGLAMRMFLYCDALLSMLQLLFSYMYQRHCSSSSLNIHDDVTMWKHFPHFWPLCGEPIGHRWFPLARVGSAYVYLLLAWTNCQRYVWVACNFKCHDTHVTPLNVASNPIWFAYDL